MSDAIYCIVPTEEDAAAIVDALKIAGFQNKDISILLPDTNGGQNIGYKNDTKAPEGVAAGAGAGALLGGALGWLTGIGAIAIPGVGPFIAAGPIMSILSAAAVGGGMGGLVGGLIGWGMPEYEAQQYENNLRSGNILLCVHSRNSEEAKKAESLFNELGGYDVKRTAEVRPKVSR